MFANVRSCPAGFSRVLLLSHKVMGKALNESHVVLGISHMAQSGAHMTLFLLGNGTQFGSGMLSGGGRAFED